MKVTIDLATGPSKEDHVTKADMQKNIDAVQRHIDGRPGGNDFVLLGDTRSILEAIQRQLPNR